MIKVVGVTVRLSTMHPRDPCFPMRHRDQRKMTILHVEELLIICRPRTQLAAILVYYLRIENQTKACCGFIW